MQHDALSIVPLAAPDLPPCATLMAESEPWTRYNLDYPAALALWTGALRDGASVHVARSSTDTLGFAWYIARGGFGLSGYLKLIGVSAAARGLGVGSLLLEHTEQLALSDGQRDLFLLVSDFNLAAQRFYQHRGYRQVGSLADYVVPGISELIYHRILRERGQ